LEQSICAGRIRGSEMKHFTKEKASLQIYFKKFRTPIFEICGIKMDREASCQRESG
jgi:hypothetical protein